MADIGQGVPGAMVARASGRDEGGNGVGIGAAEAFVDWLPEVHAASKTARAINAPTLPSPVKGGGKCQIRAPTLPFPVNGAAPTLPSPVSGGGNFAPRPRRGWARTSRSAGGSAS